MVCIGVFYWVAPLPRTYWVYFTNSSAPLHLAQHLEQKFYWLDNRSSMADYTVFVMIMLPFTFLCATLINVKLVTTSISITYCAKFADVVKLAVEDLDDISSMEQLSKKLAEVVSLHKKLLCCVQMLDKTLNPVLLLQWALCVLNWSVTLLYLYYCGINLRSVTIIIMFSLIALETFLYCALGTLLAARGEQLERALYSRRWYTLSIEMQKNLLLMLSRAQKPLRITVGKFYQLNVEEFG
ncbi:putative odorant receptor Or4 [Anopheles sinensis]|uniref:Putative odorant receptor Or4 n=1 Tax=Anopheles sinensis TaxID=74873 RepID=A0A084WBD5_ANOSI|nr:putative odorant receptor Or4 [Anopheles sinensis]